MPEGESTEDIPCFPLHSTARSVEVSRQQPHSSPLHEKEPVPTETVGCDGQAARFPSRSTASTRNCNVEPATKSTGTSRYRCMMQSCRSPDEMKLLSRNVMSLVNTASFARASPDCTT